MPAIKITYEDKIGIIPKSTHINQWWDDDSNEVKTAINNHADLIDAFIGKVEVFGNPFTLLKHPINNDPLKVNILENNDFILNGFFNNTTLWDKAQCVDATNKDLEESWTVFGSSEDLIIV